MKLMSSDKTAPRELLTLFHGTSNASMKSIIQTGFDPRLSGAVHGERFGKGTYMSPSAAIALKYTKEKTLIVSRALVGESCQSDPAYVLPPYKDVLDTTSGRYDSCVDSVVGPTKYIFFEKDQAYPEYVVKLA